MRFTYRLASGDGVRTHFCGNKSVFAVLNSHQRTVKYDFGRLPCKNRTVRRRFLLRKKCEAPKRAHFLMIFCEREGCCTKPFAIALRCCLCGAKSVTYALNNLQRMAYCFGCLPLITSIYRRTNARHLKAVFYVQILANTNEVVCHTASECLPKDV